MDNFTVSIFGSKIFLEILNELKLFSKFEIKFYEDLNLCIRDADLYKQLTIFFINEENKEGYERLIKKNLPVIILYKNRYKSNIFLNKLVEKISMPFSALYLQNKIISLLSKYEFQKSSIIDLSGYIIDKNERKIKKDNLEIQLTEKEINFLILFSKNKGPIRKDYVLKNVWKYSLKSDTHTVETHIHRLRKKILKIFNDNNFIKNNEKGYYI